MRVTTGARLHFGLLDTAAPFGGVGVMVDQPATEIVVRPNAAFVADDSIIGRATKIVTRLCHHVGWDGLPACQINLVAAPPSHCGLGSGTQLSMAIAESICAFFDVDIAAETLAVEIAGRGKRSAIGVHGYYAGGLIDERADSPTDLNPLNHRIELPESWRVIVMRPKAEATTISGDTEIEQFSALKLATAEAKSNLIHILDHEILPAARAADFATFASSVQRYNYASGMFFASVQGGPYHGEDVARLIDETIGRGGHGVGQSSWGPGVFAWFESAGDLERFTDNLPADVDVIAKTKPKHQPRSIEIES
ncbi:GHMP family kinase ATP-binding protein [Rubripirellula reticaptiva]|uniref:GHMP family kinase ATP-binding protein n=1 Tax=Rubripirellula reticaptiva TaxID=2528013 RepID=UPI0016468312|nr:beta-ribofuranosylaminobenzene 5'-phosphate synthase [Rubripirellula reticaptiva]